MLRTTQVYRAEYKILGKLGVPVIVTQLGILIVSFADTIMVGRCGTRELGAAAFVSSLYMVVIVMQIGFANGLTPLIGALHSRGDTSNTGAMMKAGVLGNLIVGSVFTLIMGILYFFLDKMGQPSELLVLVRPYYLIMLSTLIPMAVFNAFQQTSNGCTDTSTPMWIIVGCNVLNIFGNWLLIGGEMGFPKLGLTGAGISTMVARYMMLIIMLSVYIFRPSRRVYLQGRVRGIKTVFNSDLKKVWVTSYPVMLQSGMECFLWSFGGVVCGWFGTYQIASYQIVMTISQLGFMVNLGFGVAVSIRVANLTGLGDFLGVRRTTQAGLHLILLLSTISSVCLYFYTGDMLHIFTNDSRVIAAGLPLIAPLILYQYFDAIQLTYANALRGTSEVKPLLWVALAAYILAGTPCALWFAKGLGGGNVGVFYSFAVALAVAGLGYFISFRRALGKLERAQRGAGTPKPGDF